MRLGEVFVLLKNNLCSTTIFKNSLSIGKLITSAQTKKHPTIGSVLYQNFRTSLKNSKSLNHSKVLCQPLYSVKNSKQ